MKLTKPEYNENVVDVDALEKHRIQQEAETERTLILEQEKTKRTSVETKELTKRGDGYVNLRTGFIIAFAIIFAIVAIAGGIVGNNYIEVLKARVELQKAPPPVCPPPPKCPEVSCQAVPVKN